MKKTVFILAFLACFISYQGFAFPSPEKNGVTKEDITKLEGAMKGDITKLETAMKGEITRLETSMRGEITRLEEIIGKTNPKDGEEDETGDRATSDQIPGKINNGNNNDNYSDNADYNRSLRPSTKVMDKGSLEPQGVIAYIKKMKNPALNNTDIAIINEYFREAGGVNVDIAIAQMLYWTNYFKNRERVATRNYGGLSRIGNFKGTFSSRPIGVRAHIQHLMGYARVKPRDIVDPRYQLAYDRGSPGISFEQVYRWWSEDPCYGQKINRILSELYRFSGVL